MSERNKGSEERITKVVYGETFACYNKQEFTDFLRPLEVRLEKNGINQSVFRGKKCFDAGCGGGRGSVLMARAGASEVVSYDLAEQNVETTIRNASLFGLENIRTQCGSLLKIPFEDSLFDVVWCNGVLHHTVDPDKALAEVVRVLKPGGNMWLYLYGSGGIYWYMVDFFRLWLGDMDIHTVMLALSILKMPVGRIAEFIDDWFVPNLKRYTREDVEARLRELGVGEINYLKAGMSYDTSERRGTDSENIWMGAGDLRFWVAKTDVPSGACSCVLPDVNGIGSTYEEPELVRAFSHDFDSLAKASSVFCSAFGDLGEISRIAAAADIQTCLRDSFNTGASFDAEAFRERIGEHTEFFKKAV